MLYAINNIRQYLAAKTGKSCILTAITRSVVFCITQEPRAIIIIETRADPSQSMKSSIRDRVVKVFKVLYSRALV